MALGATLHLTTVPGYLPRRPSQGLAEVYKRNAIALVGEDKWWEPTFEAGSTDMGDVSHIMPALEASAKGSSGTGHGADYVICDPEMAYIAPAKVAAMTLIDLLAGGAAQGQQILAEFKPEMGKDAYLAFLRSQAQEIVWKMEEA